MKFNTESELVEVLKENLRSTFHRKSIEIFQEVSLGYGIADIVICDYIHNVNMHYHKQLTPFEVNIYDIIERRKFVSFDELYDTTRSKRKSILDALKALIHYEYIESHLDGFRLINQYVRPINTSIAVEAKLRNWKQALKQAYRYKWFAEYSYVVLDSFNSEPAVNNIEIFKQYNVGLASISTEGKLERYYTPKKDKPIDSKMQILLYEFIRKNYTLER